MVDAARRTAGRRQFVSRRHARVRTATRWGEAVAVLKAFRRRDGRARCGVFVDGEAVGDEPGVKMLVLLGEVGGTDEYAVVEALKSGRISKPVVAASGAKRASTMIFAGWLGAARCDPGVCSDLGDSDWTWIVKQKGVWGLGGPRRAWGDAPRSQGGSGERGMTTKHCLEEYGFQNDSYLLIIADIGQETTTHSET